MESSPIKDPARTEFFHGRESLCFAGGLEYPALGRPQSGDVFLGFPYNMYINYFL